MHTGEGATSAFSYVCRTIKPELFKGFCNQVGASVQLWSEYLELLIVFITVFDSAHKMTNSQFLLCLYLFVIMLPD